MGSLQLRLPERLHKVTRRYAKKDNTSMNQFIVTALSNEVIRYETLDFFEPIATKHNEENFISVLNRIPDSQPEKKDRIMGTNA
ncbi:MAG: toxin-antitoxin system HicB family antitoxin [Spirochaetes bacterium]|nr:toxin-antitoxin system HicB family antitoxin [Spirochaetota bacterium]